MGSIGGVGCLRGAVIASSVKPPEPLIAISEGRSFSAKIVNHYERSTGTHRLSLSGGWNGIGWGILVCTAKQHHHATQGPSHDHQRMGTANGGYECLQGERVQ